MKLHEFNAFPSPRRVRIFLAEKGLDDVEMIQVDVPGGAARHAFFLAKNPLGEVPVLELDDGTCISETTAISKYFEALKPRPALFGADAKEIALVEMWQRRLEAGLMNASTTYFHHATPGLGELETYQNKEWGEKSRERAIATMALLDRHLEGKSFIAGEHYSIADITALCGVDFAKFCGIEMPADAGHLRAWYDRAAKRPSAAA